MNDLDFLPADYICVRTTRTSNNWLRGLFVVVAALMVVGWKAQQHSLEKLTERRNQLQAQTDALLAQLGSPDALRRELKEVENHGRLLDVLRLSVPPTRWLSAITLALPSQVFLREVRANYEDNSERTERPTGARSAQSPPIERAGDPVEIDLGRLSKAVDRQALVISLSGTAADDLAVSSFLNALQRTNLFDRVQLLYTDQHEQRGLTQRSFGLRLRMRVVPGRIAPQSHDSPRPAITRRPAQRVDVPSFVR